MLGLHRHIIDFEILPTSNSNVIVFLDESEYFEKPELPLLKILPPGYTKFFQVNINEGEVNVLNSHLIGYTNVLENDALQELPDGIWKFTYMICPYEYLQKTKYFLRYNQLNEVITRIYNNLELCEEDLMSKSCAKNDLIDIHILLESAKANAESGHIGKSNKDFSLAQKKAKKLLHTIIDKTTVNGL